MSSQLPPHPTRLGPPPVSDALWHRLTNHRPRESTVITLVDSDLSGSWPLLSPEWKQYVWQRSLTSADQTDTKACRFWKSVVGTDSELITSLAEFLHCHTSPRPRSCYHDNARVPPSALLRPRLSDVTLVLNDWKTWFGQEIVSWAQIEQVRSVCWDRWSPVERGQVLLALLCHTKGGSERATPTRREDLLALAQREGRRVLWPPETMLEVLFLQPRITDRGLLSLASHPSRAHEEESTVPEWERAFRAEVVPLLSYWLRNARCSFTRHVDYSFRTAAMARWLETKSADVDQLRNKWWSRMRIELATIGSRVRNEPMDLRPILQWACHDTAGQRAIDKTQLESLIEPLWATGHWREVAMLLFERFRRRPAMRPLCACEWDVGWTMSSFLADVRSADGRGRLSSESFPIRLLFGALACRTVEYDGLELLRNSVEVAELGLCELVSSHPHDCQLGFRETGMLRTAGKRWRSALTAALTSQDGRGPSTGLVETWQRCLRPGEVELIDQC